MNNPIEFALSDHAVMSRIQYNGTNYDQLSSFLSDNASAYSIEYHAKTKECFLTPVVDIQGVTPRLIRVGSYVATTSFGTCLITNESTVSQYGAWYHVPKEPLPKLEKVKVRVTFQMDEYFAHKDLEISKSEDKPLSMVEVATQVQTKLLAAGRCNVRLSDNGKQSIDITEPQVLVDHIISLDLIGY